MHLSVLLSLLLIKTNLYLTQKCDFQTAYAWSNVNFTWKSYKDYSKALEEKLYIPENVMLGGIKFYQDKLYITTPKFRRGVPVTLTYIRTSLYRRNDPLLTPFPNWELNDERSCDNLQSVLGIEIDVNGVMWVIDGVRINNNNMECPAKIILFDILNNGVEIQRYQVPKEISLQNGGFMNDIVVDGTDGGYGYITDNSIIDPGLIVFSRQENRAWKLRDRTMFGEFRASGFSVKNDVISQIYPIDGIALSPLKEYERTVYFTSLTGIALYGINTSLLKNEEVTVSGIWRNEVEYFGDKQAQSDGMIMDNQGNLYYGLIPLYGVGKWNIYESFQTSGMIYSSEENMIWTDGFAMDEMGYLYLITNWGYRFFDLNYQLNFNDDIKFRIHKCHTGTKSYLYE